MKPTYSKWRRRLGGVKVCKTCGHRQKPQMRVAGRPQRIKNCLKCNADLPAKIVFPKKAGVSWYVRETDPVTAKTTDHCIGKGKATGYPNSSEGADEFARVRQRDYTPDPIQSQLLEQTSVLIRRCQAGTIDEATGVLIEQLGGDPSARNLKPIGWDEARDIICGELRDKGKSELYIADVFRVTTDLRGIAGLDKWSDVSLDAVAKYRTVRMRGGWQREDRTIKAVGGRAINKDLATLSAFLTRAVRKGWITRNPLEGAKDERVKVDAVRVDYMPDVDLQALIAKATPIWLRIFVIVAYYTGSRRGDLLSLEWERDLDLDGTKAAPEGRSGPHLYVRGAKADTPHWMPLHGAAVVALKKLRREPVIDKRVFPVRGSVNPGGRVSHLFADLCVAAGLTKTVDRDGQSVAKNRWTLHDLRRKANTDLRNRGASPKERAALLGHRTTAVNESHYEAVLPGRERELIDGLPAFGVAG